MTETKIVFRDDSDKADIKIFGCVFAAGQIIYL